MGLRVEKQSWLGVGGRDSEALCWTAFFTRLSSWAPVQWSMGSHVEGLVVRAVALPSRQELKMLPQPPASLASPGI